MTPPTNSGNHPIETDADLLTIISFKNEAKEDSDRAFSQFYEIYAPFLLTWVSFHCGKHKNKIIGEEVFAATIRKAYKYSHTFSNKGIKDPVIVKKLIKGWLNRIAHNEYLNLMIGMKTEKEDFKEYQGFVIAKARVKNAAIKQSQHALAIREALGSLSDRDREVFLTCLEYHKEGKNLPKEITKSICDRFEITDASRRQICTRARKKVYDYLEAKQLLKTV